ncbi:MULTISPECIES: type III secretion system translocon subunit SctB [unclassified Morganella (in: enterobacteria)]|uniref:type III secretion system translocon subunit SctB n=1 Tax=unclassified Morganella (in: enterobacteria) TaxID=2676694 RepID=UPI002943C92E|nr:MULTISPECIES: type III secretion system translocon subunit SctB [unclassified Morganella (in: enterobacteria)]
MDAISGIKTPVITLNDIQQPDSKLVKTAESGGKTPVEMGHSPVKNTVIGGDSGIALPKPPADGKDSSVLDSISSSLADLQSLLSSVKDAKEQISNKLSEITNFASVDNLKASAGELNLSSNWQMAFSVISGVLSVGTMVLSNVSAYQDHIAAQQENALNSGIEKTQSDIAKTTEALKDPGLTAEGKKALDEQLAALNTSLESQQDALAELMAGTETRKAWTELALNLMQGASGFISDNLLSGGTEEGDTLSVLDDIISKSESVLEKAKNNMAAADAFPYIPAKA